MPMSARSVTQPEYLPLSDCQETKVALTRFEIRKYGNHTSRGMKALVASIACSETAVVSRLGRNEAMIVSVSINRKTPIK